MLCEEVGKSFIRARSTASSRITYSSPSTANCGTVKPLFAHLHKGNVSPPSYPLTPSNHSSHSRTPTQRPLSTNRSRLLQTLLSATTLPNSELVIVTMVNSYYGQTSAGYNAWQAKSAGYARADTSGYTSKSSKPSRRHTVQACSPESTSSHASLPAINFRLHSLIAAPSPQYAIPNLTWDMRFPPSFARLNSSPKYGIPSRYTSEYATSPPVSRMRISCELFGSRWRMEVSNHRGVTVGDILEQVYASLHKRVRSGEWAVFSESEKAYISRAFYKRVNLSRYPKEERDEGALRVDILQKNTYFVGLKPDPAHQGSWVLSTMRYD